MNTKSFESYNPQKSLPKKFKIGDKPHHLNENLNLTPVFSFEFISLKGKQYCLNFDKIIVKDYHKFLEKLKEVSSITYKEIQQGVDHHKFHSVDFDGDIQLTKHQYKKYLTSEPEKLNDDQLPTLYQFKIFEEKRVFGFLGYNGLFYIILYDIAHNVYKRK